MMDLTKLRNDIDVVDKELVKLFIARMNLAGEVAKYKQAHGLPIHVPAREEEKLCQVAQQSGPHMAEYTRGLYETIFSLSRDYQQRCMDRPVCGLIGRKLGHSYSPRIHSLLGDYSYDRYELEPEELENFLHHGPLTGFNVTMPYKTAVIPYLDALSPIAQRLGAVNTVVRRADGTLIGHNTDHFGFQTMLWQSGLQVSGKKVLVLGSGGASRPVRAVLEEAGAIVVVISRNGENHYGNLSLHSDAAVIVNTTPVGMYPDTGVSPIDLDLFPNLEGVLDIIFNPAQTKLLLDAKARGIVAMNGLLMLVAQAKEASEWFTGKQIHDSRIMEIYGQLMHFTKNIALIGMPGSGKSTIASLLARKLHRTIVDVDHLIEIEAGKSIPEIFAEDGEASFRDLETKVLEHWTKESGLIIDTGGGCVTRSENLPLLKQNSWIVWIDRDMGQLATEGRPLSLAMPLSEMWDQRKPLYEAFADIRITNDRTPEEACEKIIALWEECL